MQDIAKRAAHGAWFEEDPGPCYFACHKRIPIVIDQVKSTISFDFEAAGLKAVDQTCAGFLKMMWALQEKAGG